MARMLLLLAATMVCAAATTTCLRGIIATHPGVMPTDNDLVNLTRALCPGTKCFYSKVYNLPEGKGGNPEDHDVDVHLYGCLPGYMTEYNHQLGYKVPVHPDAMPNEVNSCTEKDRCLRNHKTPYVEYGDALCCEGAYCNGDYPRELERVIAEKGCVAVTEQEADVFL